ncbi:MAG: L-2-hydroxyglutarate oxidase [Flavobacteriales bacterium]|nr:L-2-hydroxyglutarate oxidase [Flavobacteriales bacterium]
MIASFDIAVVGGGIVGVATAYKLQLAYPDHSIAVIEKEKRLADHQTGNNSGVIHSGIYYKPGSYKARLCVNGRRELVQFAQDYNVAHDICGKVVVATERNELKQLDAIYQRALDNQVEDVRRINAAEIKDLEPYCAGIAGMQVGCTGIIDYRAMTERMAALLEGMQESSRIFLDHEVVDVIKDGERTRLKTKRGDIEAKYVVFCGGLQADRLAMKAKVDLDMRVLGFRGDYFVLSEEGRHKVKNLIYPVPNPEFPFLGVHFTRMVNGEVECGPNAVFVFKREGYNKTDFDLKDTADALAYPGTWKFFAKHWRYGIEEYRRAFSKQLFLKTLQKLIPSLEMNDLSEERAGVRAMALGDDGNMIDDFKIEYKDNCIHVLNAPSPAATACLAIGEEVRKMASDYFKLD